MRFFENNQPHYQIVRKRRRLRACEGCDMINTLPILRPGEQACCIRCGHILARRHLHPVQRSVALATTAFICLLISASFPYISVESSSFHHQIALPQTAETLIHFHQPLVALIIAFNIVVLPAIYLVSLIIMQAGVLRNVPKTYSQWIAKGFSLLHPWMMADVFVVASLVSLVKLIGMTDVDLGISFWAYCIFALLLLMTTRSVDTDWLWTALVGNHNPPAHARSGITAATQHMVGCHTCGLINQLPVCGETKCRRCASKLHIRSRNSLQKTSALLLSALILYIPANVYPIMITTSLGKTNPSTIVGGMLELWQQGSQPIAAIIFITSILVPVLKILSLTLLSYVVYKTPALHADQRSLLYRITEFIGRWSMVDVFVVAIMVALIQSGNLMSVTPGPAALAFCAVVVVTMLAAMAFDQRLIWDHQGKTHE